jgi:hypothetical protein
MEDEAVLHVFQKSPHDSDSQGKPKGKHLKEFNERRAQVVRDPHHAHNNWRYNFQIGVPIGLLSRIILLVIPELNAIMTFHKPRSLDKEHKFFICQLLNLADQWFLNVNLLLDLSMEFFFFF